jgi:hypothetical protein
LRNMIESINTREPIKVEKLDLLNETANESDKKIRRNK